MEGTWDNLSKTGNVEIGAFISANGVAKEAFSDDPNMENIMQFGNMIILTL